MTQTFEFNVNGKRHCVQADPLARLLDVLRDELKLAGTKEGCGEGECGACTVLVDGVSVTACLVPVCQVAGCEITTIEATGHEHIQEAFLEHGGTQCGMCTPGMIVQTRTLMENWEGTAPTSDDVREAIAGNLCRCTGYGKIVTSVLAAWEKRS